MTLSAAGPQIDIPTQHHAFLGDEKTIMSKMNLRFVPSDVNLGLSQPTLSPTSLDQNTMIWRCSLIYPLLTFVNKTPIFIIILGPFG
jgi:hypothetical protein